MIFRRKRNLSILERLRAIFWPRSGFVRAGRYLVMRVKRMPGSPHNIAAGIAAGAAVSCTPLVGFHFLLGFAIAYLVRGNMLAAAIGTAAGNPWTFPFLWAASYQVGVRLFEGGGAAALDDKIPGWQTIAQDIGAYFWPTAIGAIPVGCLIFVVTYVAARKLVSLAHARRRARREAALARRAALLDKPSRPPSTV